LSALRTLARCAGRDPGDIPALPASLCKTLKDAPYTLAGVGKRRWEAVRYLTLAGLRVAGFNVMPGRRTAAALSPAWKALLLLAPDRQSGIGLSRFISYCSAAGIEPPDVDLAVFQRFQQELEHNSIVPTARFNYRTTCVLWNKASKSVPQWPTLELAVPNASKQYSLDWDVFPESFRADVEAFLDNAGNQDPLSDNYAPIGPAGHDPGPPHSDSPNGDGAGIGRLSGSENLRFGDAGESRKRKADSSVLSRPCRCWPRERLCPCGALAHRRASLGGAR